MKAADGAGFTDRQRRRAWRRAKRDATPRELGARVAI